MKNPSKIIKLLFKNDKLSKTNGPSSKKQHVNTAELKVKDIIKDPSHERESFGHLQETTDYVLNEYSNVGARKFLNIDFLFCGYQLTKSNPFTTKGIDPGFTMGHIFQVEYRGLKTADGRYLVPQGIYAPSSIACQNHAVSEMFKTAEQYEQHLSINIGAQVSTSVVSGHLDAQVRDKIAFLKESDTMIASSQKMCQLYSVEVNLINALKLTKSFLMALENCNISSRDSVNAFASEFGSHFLHSIIMGHRTGVEAMMVTNTLLRRW